MICGGCGDSIAEGAPLLLITKDGFKWGSDGKGFRRCAECAGVASPDLPAEIVTSSRTKRAEGITTIGKRAFEDLRRDWKQKQAGD